MSLDLSTLDPAPRTKEVILTMRKTPLRVEVRGVSQAETRLIEKAFTPPVPPRKKDPKAGSLSTVPDLEDPGYQAQLTEYYIKQHNASVAIAAGLKLRSGTTFPSVPETEEARAKWLEPAKAWVVEAEAQLSTNFSNTEIEMLALKMKQLSGGDVLKEAVHQLIIEVPKNVAGGDGGGEEFADEIDEPKDPLELPENYTRTADGLIMRACRAFGKDPFTWPLTWSADQRTKILADQTLFEREEREHRSVLRMIAMASVGTSVGT